jgi:hypothetical protein
MPAVLSAFMITRSLSIRPLAFLSIYRPDVVPFSVLDIMNIHMLPPISFSSAACMPILLLAFLSVFRIRDILVRMRIRILGLTAPDFMRKGKEPDPHPYPYL